MHVLARLSISTLSVAIAVSAGVRGFAVEPKSGTRTADAPSSEAFFSGHVLPILKQHCYKCHSHGAKKAQGGLVLDSRSGWKAGGDSGPAVISGNADRSLLIQSVRYADLKMPPGGKLAASEIGTLERWVGAGAVEPRQSAETNTGFGLHV